MHKNINKDCYHLFQTSLISVKNEISEQNDLFDTLINSELKSSDKVVETLSDQLEL